MAMESVQMIETVNSVSEIKSPTIIEKFETTYEDNLRRDPYGKDRLQPFRALKETLRDKRFYTENYTNEDIRILANHFLDEPKYNQIFKEWLTTRQLEWGLKTFPRNMHKLFAFGKNEVERRKQLTDRG